MFSKSLCFKHTSEMTHQPTRRAAQQVSTNKGGLSRVSVLTGPIRSLESWRESDCEPGVATKLIVGLDLYVCYLCG